jgi:hypothetical protein
VRIPVISHTISIWISIFDMQINIKPKRTRYKGIWFRSRLEARWAVFFDAIGIEYRYEPEHDEVQAGWGYAWYKPDFFMPGLDCYIEIKPKEPTDFELAKAAGWADIYDGDFYIFYEFRPPSEDSDSACLLFWSNRYKKVIPSYSHWWTECLECHRIAITENGEPPHECLDKCYTREALDYRYNWYSMSGREYDDEVYPYSSRSPRLLKAYSAARKATFK